MEDVSGTIPKVPREGAGSLYLHVPFCESLCPFCSFHRVQHCRPRAQVYFHFLRQEVLRYYEAGFRFSAAYFGGGTPTTEPEELVKTVNYVRKLFDVREISVETNPRDLRPEILLPLREAGVTRLSVGVQTFDDDLLKEIERYETYGSGAEAEEHIKDASGIFPTLNVDLIFNLPGQDLGSLMRDIEIVQRTGANQLSFYPLMSSAEAKQRMKPGVASSNRTRLRQFYNAILTGLGPDFAPCSAWCFKREAKTTDEYIVEADYYIGVGSGAFSYVDGKFYATSFSLNTYEKRIAEGLTGITAKHRLSVGDQMRYSLLVKMFGLKLDRRWVMRHYGRKFSWWLWGELRTLELFGAAQKDPSGWKLTKRGMYWLMLMMTAFFESVAEYRDTMRKHIAAEMRENRQTNIASEKSRPGSEVVIANGRANLRCKLNEGIGEAQTS
jgi:coproporphyrinogen III oxidase-like Fe-S oxidoreductase